MEGQINLSSPPRNPFVQKIPLSSLEPASLTARVCAFLLDYILLLLILGVGIIAASFLKPVAPTVAEWIVVGVWVGASCFAVWNWVYRALREGARVGQEFAGLRIVRADGRELDLKSILMRHVVGYGVCFATLGLGFLWALFSAKNTAWHDRLSGTMVVKVI